MKTKTERHPFSKLSDDVKHRLVEEVAQTYLSLFHHALPDHPRTYWLEKKSYETVLYVLRSEDGTLVGSTTFKFYRVNYEGKSIDIVKFGLGVDPKYRGNKFALRCMMEELWRWNAAHPAQPLYLFSTLIHPVTYKLCCDLLGERLYPYFKAPDNPARQKMMEFLANHFGVKRSDSPYPFAFQERFSAVETPEAVVYWRNSERPEVRFFVEHCPNYHCSFDCLICLAPITIPYVLSRMVRTLARNRIDRWRGRKPKFAR